MPKKLLAKTAICATLVFTSCFRSVDPDVATRYFHPGDREEHRGEALSADLLYRSGEWLVGPVWECKCGAAEKAGRSQSFPG